MYVITLPPYLLMAFSLILISVPLPDIKAEDIEGDPPADDFSIIQRKLVNMAGGPVTLGNGINGPSPLVVCQTYGRFGLEGGGTPPTGGRWV